MDEDESYEGPEPSWVVWARSVLVGATVVMLTVAVMVSAVRFR
ncbi:hypothetical protein [Streptomyces sp. ODS28]